MLNTFKYKEYHIQIKFTNSVTFPFFHGQKLNQLFCSILNQHPLPNNLIIFPAEVGRINYKEGESYNFGITLLGNEILKIETIENGLLHEAKRERNNQHFRGNFTLTNIKEKQIPSFKKFLTSQNRFEIQFITPLRIKRKNPTKGKKFFSPNIFEPEQFLKLLYNRICNSGILSEKGAEEKILPEIPEIKIIDKTLIWVDVPYSKTLGGVIGKVVLEGKINEFWQNILWLGQFINAGNLTAFGFGKYVLLNNKNTIDYIKPANTLLNKILNVQNLIDSVNHIKLRSEKDSYGRKRIIEYENDLLNKLNELVKKVKQNKYNPGNLTGIILPKGKNKIRALAIPPLEDKILQRATTQIISPSIEQLLEESSFAYRKGFSRQSAARTISKAQKEGYKYVFKADINSFFDNVDWELLFKKLDVIFFNEPVLELIKKWVVQSVEYNGKIIKRTKGLPQGLPISPLLANLFLDEFDEALQDDFKLIRYADDFLILCKTKEQLINAKAEADKVLDKLQLEFKDSKTETTSFDNGFFYLGYLFVKSLITEKKKNDYSGTPLKKVNSNYEIPAGSWLNSVNLNELKPIEKLTKPVEYKTEFLHPHLRDKHKIPIYISNPELSVYLNDKSLIIQNKSDNSYKEKRIPIGKILFLVFIGRARISLPAVIRLRHSGVPSFFLRSNGTLYLSIRAEQINYSLWQKQAELFLNNDFALPLAKSIISAQIHNYKIIARRNLNVQANINDTLLQLAALENSVTIAKNIDELRGYEGKSAAVFYSNIKKAIDLKWNFISRTKHPPEDPVNVLLSIGFTMLYNHIAAALQFADLNPEIGFYHKPKPFHFALASDLVEEFRFIIISHVLYLIHRNILTPEDFSYKENSKFPCVMKYEARKTFISSLEERLNEKITYDKNIDAVTYKHYFYIKAKMIKDLLNNPEAKYIPLRTK